MPSFEHRLSQAIAELRRGEAGMVDVLSALVRQLRDNDLLSFSLESTHGPIYTDGPLCGPTAAGDENNLAALPALTCERNTKKRFFCTMTERRWEVLSAFTLGQPFFTTLTLDISDPTGAALRAGLFKLADLFTSQCRRLMQWHISGIAELAQAEEQFPFEKAVLRQVVNFSPSVQCALLIDDDGFIVHTEGGDGLVDELGSVLARLFYRCRRVPCLLDGADYSAITLSDPEFTIRIGRLTGTTLAFAVSVGGPFATAAAHFLHAFASDALCAHALEEGCLWGVATTPHRDPARIRTSWFSAPRLVARGKFVGKKGGKSFHAIDCQILARTDPSRLDWFDARAAAIAKGLRPCGACNP
jgi:hypothetical protein